MSLVIWFLDHIGPQDFADDPRYLEERRWAHACEFDDRLSSVDGAGHLLLEHARQMYADVRDRGFRIDSKLNDMLKLSGTLAVLLVTAVKAFEMPITWYVTASFVCLFIALVVAMLSRQAFLMASLPSIRSVVKGVPGDNHDDAWLATAIHLSCEARRVSNAWAARRIFLATLFIVLAILFLSPIVWPTSSSVDQRPPSADQDPAVATAATERLGHEAAAVAEPDAAAEVAVKPAFLGQPLQCPSEDPEIVVSPYVASTPRPIRTGNLRFRRPMLYPIEVAQSETAI